MKMFRIPAALLCVWFAAGAHAQGLPVEKMDVAGIRIGMTEAEVMKALKTFDAGARVVRREVASFPYSDGVNILNSPDFLDMLEVNTNGGSFRIWFASPPSESRVYALVRNGSSSQPPTGEQFTTSLVAKYGPPSARSLRGQPIVQFDQAGKPQCTVGRDRAGQRVPAENTQGTLLPPNATKVLEQQARQSVPHLREALGTPADPSRCGTVLRYQWLGDPVRSFEAWLVDQGEMVAIERRSAKWVAGLQSEATAKRKAAGQTPRL